MMNRYGATPALLLADIEGVGLTSGVTYTSNANGLAQENVEADNDLIGESTVVARAIVIGPGALPNAFALALGHITVTPDGTVTAFFDDIRMSCP